MFRWLLVFFWALTSVAGQPLGPAYFVAHEGTEKCFYETVPNDMPISVTYKVRENEAGITCLFLFREPNGRTAFSKEVPPTETTGVVTYTTRIDGEHQICLHCQSSQWFGSHNLKWSLSIELGEPEMSSMLQDPPKAEQMSSVDRKLQHLMTQFNVISAENQYEKNREAEFRDMSEGINTRVVWMSVARMVVVGIACALSVWHLKRFFQHQKYI